MSTFFSFKSGRSIGQSRESATENSIVTADLSSALASFDSTCNYSLDDGWLTAFENFIGHDLDELVNLVPDDLRRMLNSSDEEEDDLMSFSLSPAAVNSLRESAVIVRKNTRSSISTLPLTSVQSVKTAVSKPSGPAKPPPAPNSMALLDESARIPVPLPLPGGSRPERNYDFQLAQMKAAHLADPCETDRRSEGMRRAQKPPSDRISPDDVVDHIGKADVHLGAAWQRWTPFQSKPVNRMEQRSSELQSHDPIKSHDTKRQPTVDSSAGTHNKQRTSIGKYKFHLSGAPTTVHPKIISAMGGNIDNEGQQSKHKLEVNTSRPSQILESIATRDGDEEPGTPKAVGATDDENKRVSIGRYKFHASLPSPVRTKNPVGIKERMAALSPLRSPSSDQVPQGSPRAHHRKPPKASQTLAGVTAVRLSKLTGGCDGSDHTGSLAMTVELSPATREKHSPVQHPFENIEAMLSPKSKPRSSKKLDTMPDSKNDPNASGKLMEKSEVKTAATTNDEVTELGTKVAPTQDVGGNEKVSLKSAEPSTTPSQTHMDDIGFSTTKENNLEKYRPIKIKTAGGSQMDSALENVKSPDTSAALKGDTQQTTLSTRDNNLSIRQMMGTSNVEDERRKTPTPQDNTFPISSVMDCTRENNHETMIKSGVMEKSTEENKPESVSATMTKSDMASSKESTVALKIRSLAGNDGVEIQRGLSPGRFYDYFPPRAIGKVPSLYDSEGNRLETQLVPQHPLQQSGGFQNTRTGHKAHNQEDRAMSNSRALTTTVKNVLLDGDGHNNHENPKAIKPDGPEPTNQDHPKAKPVSRLHFFNPIKLGSKRIRSLSTAWKKSDMEHESVGQASTFDGIDRSSAEAEAFRKKAPANVTVDIHPVEDQSGDRITDEGLSIHPTRIIETKALAPRAPSPVANGQSGKGLKSFLVSPFHRGSAKRLQPVLETIQEITSVDAVNGSETGSKPSLGKLSMVALKPHISPAFDFKEANNVCHAHGTNWPTRQYTLGFEAAHSPVVLYPILDFNPCRPELLLEVDMREYLQSAVVEGVEVVPTLQAPPLPPRATLPKDPPETANVGCFSTAHGNASQFFNTDNTGCKCIIRSSSAQTASTDPSDGSNESHVQNGVVQRPQETRETAIVRAEARETNIECPLGFGPTDGSVPSVDGPDDDVSTRVAGSSNTRAKKGQGKAPVGQIAVLEPQDLIGAINTIQKSGRHKKSKKSHGLSKDEMKIARRLYTDLKVLSKIEKKMKKLGEQGDRKNDETMTVLTMMDKMVKRRLKKELQKQRLIADNEDAAATEALSATLTALGLSKK